MQFPRNSSSSRRHNQIQWNGVIKFYSIFSQYCVIITVHVYFRVISILEWFLPDIVMLISAPSIYLLLRRLTATDTPDVESAGSTEQAESSQISNENLNILKKIGEFDL